MRLITQRTLIRDVATRWAEQYPEQTNPTPFSLREAAIGRRLKELDVETATPDDVAAIIGNRSWCNPPTCDECKTRVPVAVELGEELEEESSTATVCFGCLQKALALIETTE